MHNLLEAVGFRVDRMETFGAWKEAVLIPVYYAALRLRLGNVLHNPIHAQIASEYTKTGWYALCAKTIKPL